MEHVAQAHGKRAGGADVELATPADLDRVDLSAYRWKRRLLLIFAPSANVPEYMRQVGRLVGHRAQLADRDVTEGALLPAACDHPGMLKGGYRLLENPAVAPAAVLASHVQATLEWAREVPLVLAVQDTTELDYTHHPGTTGLGPIGNGYGRGLLVHTTLAITPDRLPLGLLAQQDWARDPDDRGKKRRRKQLPIGQKESQKWLTSLQTVNAWAAECPGTRFVSVGDAEADIY